MAPRPATCHGLWQRDLETVRGSDVPERSPCLLRGWNTEWWSAAPRSQLSQWYKQDGPQRLRSKRVGDVKNDTAVKWFKDKQLERGGKSYQTQYIICTYTWLWYIYIFIQICSTQIFDYNTFDEARTGPSAFRCRTPSIQFLNFWPTPARRRAGKLHASAISRRQPCLIIASRWQLGCMSISTDGHYIILWHLVICEEQDATSCHNDHGDGSM